MLGQIAVDDKSSEISAMLELLARLVLHGRVITGDALLTQHKIAQAIVEHGGDYLLVVKDNQRFLREDIQELFESPHLLEIRPLQVSTEQQQVCKVSIHGTRVEERVLRASTALNECYNGCRGYGDDLWAGLRQVLQITGVADQTYHNRQGHRPHYLRNCLRHHFPLTRACHSSTTVVSMERTPGILAHREQVALGARRDF